MSALLSIENLRVQFKMRNGQVTAVQDVSLSIEPGECVGIVGESGCGKTTTGLAIMRLLAGNGKITAGSVNFDGTDLASLSEAQMRSFRGNNVALIPQDPLTSLNPTTKIGRQIGEGYRIHRGVSAKEAEKRAIEVLEMVEMPRPKERLSQYPFELSGGLRQRVMIAMGLVCEPKLLIADEPTTALDVTIQAQILNIFEHLRESLGMSVILITHDMGVIAGRTDRVVVMYAGKVAEEAPTNELFKRMHHPYTQALLASVPSIEHATKVKLRNIPGVPPNLSREIVGCRFAPRCSEATDRCRVEDPPFTDSGNEHRYACFNPVEGPVPLSARTDVADTQKAVLGIGDPMLTADSGTGTVSTLAMSAAPQKLPAGAMLTLDDAGTTFEVQLASPIAAGDTSVTLAPTTSFDHNFPASTTVVRGFELVSVIGLVKEFPIKKGLLKRQVGTIHAVSGADFMIRDGETFGLVGESGCGKTTIGRMVVGLEDSTQGKILFEGRNVTRLSGRAARQSRRERQMMFQDPYSSLNPRMRVREIIREPLAIQNMGNRSEQNKRVDELLQAVGLDPSAGDRHPHEFSGGQRQRIGFARALALNPKLVIADEPVSALDVSIQAQILNLMKDLQRERGLSYIMVSHDLAVVYYMADTIGVMYLGKIVEIGDAESVFRTPAHPYTQGLLDAVPIPDPEEARKQKDLEVKGELPSAANPPSGCRFRTRCPKAQDRCAEEEPLLESFGPTHKAACHFPLRTPVSLSASASSSPS